MRLCPRKKLLRKTSGDCNTFFHELNWPETNDYLESQLYVKRRAFKERDSGQKGKRTRRMAMEINE